MNKQKCILMGIIASLFLFGCQDDSDTKEAALTGKISQANAKAVVAEVLQGKASDMTAASNNNASTPAGKNSPSAKALSRSLHGETLETIPCEVSGTMTITNNGKITTSVFDQCLFSDTYYVNGTFVLTFHSGSWSDDCSLGTLNAIYDIAFTDYYVEERFNGAVEKSLVQGTMSINSTAKDSNSDTFCDSYVEKMSTSRLQFIINGKTTEFTDYSGQYSYSDLTGQNEADFSGLLSSVAAGGTVRIKTLQTLKMDIGVPLSQQLFYSEGIVEISGGEGRILITIQSGHADDPQAVKVDFAGQTTYYSWSELEGQFEVLF